MGRERRGKIFLQKTYDLSSIALPARHLLIVMNGIYSPAKPMMAWQSTLIIIKKTLYLKLDSHASTPFTNSNEWNHSPAKPMMARQSALIIINKNTIFKAR
ncbi:hypothetical protein [Shewanella sp. SM78]|uniref:hypothetical protein n=1 Tax=Shewanella sp. SM78 TaxID=2912810 RepID=UPI0021D8EEB6|nr:hypothetical protein [Shewanella sp. SM78]MCU8020869.1 hypothetical protein [Shewanella sp. SM78]MCU8077785.1 hypothetical protein [Shewanella sp. SM103]